MIDVHCHLNFHKFENDTPEVIAEAKLKGVSTIINTGTSIPSSRLAVELAKKYENLFAIVGIHPHHADKTDHEFEGELVADWLGELEKIARSSQKVLGIGEIGMDYYSYKSNGIVKKQLQEDAFRKQIELSIKLSLPVQIHTRLAWDDTLGILGEYKSKLQTVPGMFHCFSGSIEFARKVLEAGFYVGFDGNCTYSGIPPGETTSLQDLLKFVPLDRVVVETDSPYLTPIPFRGQRNTPGNAIIVGEFIAKVKGVPFQEVDEVTTSNARTLFPRLTP
jgi:TatD DNase family protein